LAESNEDSKELISAPKQGFQREDRPRIMEGINCGNSEGSKKKEEEVLTKVNAQ